MRFTIAVYVIELENPKVLFMATSTASTKNGENSKAQAAVVPKTIPTLVVGSLHITPSP